MTTTSTAIDPAALRSFYGHIPSGVLVLAAEVDGIPVGMACSSFTNVSLDPPLVVVSIRNESNTWPLLQSATAIGASILADTQGYAGRQLATGTRDNRFADVSYTTSDAGAIAIEDAAAWFEAVPSVPVPAGDHFLVLLTLQTINVADRSALLFYRSKFAGVRHG